MAREQQQQQYAYGGLQQQHIDLQAGKPSLLQTKATPMAMPIVTLAQLVAPHPMP